MEAVIKKEISIELKLSEQEATWLMGVMQNPLHDQDPEQENKLEAMNRRNLFIALRNAFQS